MTAKFRFLLVPILICLTLPQPASAQRNSGDVDTDFLPSSFLLEGVAFARKKKFDDARQRFESALPYWQVHISSTLFLKILDDLDAKALDKKRTQNIFKAVHEDFNTKHKKAVKAFDKLIKKNAEYYPLFVLRGDALYNLEEFGEATASYANAIELAPAEALPLLARGKFYSRDSEYELAAKDFGAALKVGPASAICRFERGFAYCLQRKYSSAIKDFDAMAKVRPEWGKASVVNEAFHNRAIQLLEKKSYSKAIAYFSRAIEINPNYVNSYFSRAMAYRGKGQFSKAVAEFSLCLQKKPDFVDAYYQRAVTHQKRKHYAKAVTDLKKALELKPGNNQYLNELGESYYNQGKYKLALAQFDKVIKADPTFYWAYYWKGYSNTYLGRPKSAIAAFQRFLQLAPKRHRSQRLYAETEIRKLKKRR